MKHEQIKEMKSLYNKMYNPFSDDIPVSYIPNKGGQFEADLYGEINSPSQFSSIISALGNMEEYDTFLLNLQSWGGSVDAGDALLHAMKKCKGLIHAVATGGCHSMASCVLLHADSFELSDGFSSLIHAGSMGLGSDFQEFKQHAEFSIKATERNMREIYSGFLTEEEIISVLEGKPIVVDATGWMERHDKRNEFLQKRMEEIYGENIFSNAEGDNNPYIQTMKDNPKKSEEIVKNISGKFLEDAYDQPDSKPLPKPRKPKAQ